MATSGCRLQFERRWTAAADVYKRETVSTLRERTISRTMECSSINFDDLPSSISEFFTPEEFAEISDYEKQHLINLRQNFEALRRAVSQRKRVLKPTKKASSKNSKEKLPGPIKQKKEKRPAQEDCV